MATRETQSPIDAAQEMAPAIRSCADEIEAQRELPRPLFEALADAGIFHMAVPSSIGGGEVDLPTYTQVIEELGKADASTGWCVNQGAIYATYASRMPREMARHIWIDTPRAVVANTPAPTAKAIVVPGGYRVTGRQGFSTGCRHASWVAAHAQIIENGQVRMEGKAPETRYMFVPVAEAQLLDTWHVRGMRGTGTHHFAVDNVFVPAERTVLSATAPLLEDRPLYRIPRTLLFASGDASVAFGMARACMNTFMDLAGAKVAARHAEPAARSVDGAGDDRPVRGVAPHRQGLPQRGRPRDLGRGVREHDHARSPGANLRLATTHGIRLAAQIVDAVYSAAGATAVYEDNVLQRYFQDIHVITQHMQARLAHYELIGKHALGLKIDQARF